MKALKEFKQLRQQGYTLMEVIIVLAIIVIATVAGTLIYYVIKALTKYINS